MSYSILFFCHRNCGCVVVPFFGLSAFLTLLQTYTPSVRVRAVIFEDAGEAGKPLPLYGKDYGVCRLGLALFEEEGAGRLKPRPPYGKRTVSVQTVSA